MDEELFAWLDHRARQVGARNARAQRSAAEPDETWDQVVEAARRQFPQTQLQQSHRDFYGDAAYRSWQAERVATALRDDVDSGNRDRIRYWTSRLPFVGSLVDVEPGIQASEIAQRLEGGALVNQNDLRQLSRYLADQELNAERGFLQRTGDIATMLPGFAAEYLASGGIGNLASGAAQYGLRSLAPSLSLRAVRGAGMLAGAAARTATVGIPRVVAGTQERMTPAVQIFRDERGDVRIQTAPAQQFWEALPRGYFDTFTEYFTEGLGGTRAFRAVSGAIARPVRGTLARGLAGLGLDRASDALQRGLVLRWMRAFGQTPGQANQFLRHAGYSGMISELLEERAGELMRGGVGEGFGATGQLARGDVGGFLAQLAAEGLAFSVYGGALHAGSAGRRLLRGRQLPEPGTAEFAVARAGVISHLHGLAEADRARELERLRPFLDYYGVNPDPAAIAEEFRRLVAEPNQAAARAALTMGAAEPQPSLSTIHAALADQQRAIEEVERSQRASSAATAGSAGLAGAIAAGVQAPAPVQEPGVRGEEIEVREGAAVVAQETPVSAATEATVSGIEATPSENESTPPPADPLAALSPRQQALAEQLFKVLRGRQLETAEALRQLNARRKKIGQGKLAFAEYDALLNALEDAGQVETYELTETEGGVEPGRYVEDLREPPPAERSRIAEAAAAERAAAGDRQEREAAAAIRQEQLRALARRSRPLSLSQLVSRRGGISVQSLGAIGAAELPAHLLQVGGPALAELAAQLAAEGHLRVPEGGDPVRALIDQLRADALSALDQAKRELATAQEEFNDAVQRATQAGLPEGAIAEAVRRGEAAGLLEEARRPAPEPGEPARQGEERGQEPEPRPGRLLSRAISRPLPAAPAGAAAVAESELISPHEILATAAREFGVPLHPAHLEKTAAGLYEVADQAIRLDMNYFGNIVTAAHEIAHHLDLTHNIVDGAPFAIREFLRQLDYDPKRLSMDVARREGFAELVRVAWTEDPAKPIPQALQSWWDGWLAEHPEVARKFAKIKALIDRYRAMTPEQRVRANLRGGRAAEQPILSTGERLRGFGRTVWDGWLYHFVGEGLPLQRFQEAIEGKIGAQFLPGEGPKGRYDALAKQGPTYALWSLQHGPIRLTDYRQVNDAQGPVPGLVEILRPIEPGLDFDRASAYAFARHALEAWNHQAVNEETGETEAAPIHPGITKEDAEATVADLYSPRYEAFADGLTRFANAQLDVLVDAGVTRAEDAQAFKDEWRFYLPLWRVRPPGSQARPLAGTKYVNVGQFVKRRTGADLQIINPVEALATRTSYLYSRAVRQMIVNEVVRYAPASLTFKRKPDAVEGLGGLIIEEPADTGSAVVSMDQLGGQVLRRLEEDGVFIDAEQLRAARESVRQGAARIFWAEQWHQGDQPVVRVIEDGEYARYRFDPELYKFLAGLDFSAWTGVNKTWPWLMKWFKVFTTAGNPAFAVRNLFRDWQTFFFQREHAGLATATVGVPVEITRRAIGGMWGFLAGVVQHAATGKNFDAVESEAEQLFRLMGGEYLHFNGLELREMRSTIKQLAFHSRKNPLWQALRHPVQTLVHAVGVGETVPRFLEFKAVLENAGYPEARLRELAQRGERPPAEILRRAKIAAAEVTVNFAEQGATAKGWNQIMPYFSAHLRGTARFARWSAEATTGSRRARLLLRLGAFLGATTAVWLAIKDEDWWKELDDYLKYTALVIPWQGGAGARVPLNEGQGRFFVANWIGLLEAMERRLPAPVWQSFAQTLTDMFTFRGPVLATPLLEAATGLDFNRGFRPLENQSVQRLPAGERAYPQTTGAARALGRTLSISPIRIEHLLDSVTGRLFSAAFNVDAPRLLGYGGLLVRGEHASSMRLFYDQLTRLREQETLFELRGQPVPSELATSRYVADTVSRLMANLRLPFRQERDREARFAVDQYLIGLARAVLRQPELGRYPNPLRSANWAAMPEAIRDTVHDFLAVQAEHLSDPPPDPRRLAPAAYQTRLAEWRTQRQHAQALINLAELHPPELRQLALDRLRRRSQQTGRPLRATPANLRRLAVAQ